MDKRTWLFVMPLILILGCLSKIDSDALYSCKAGTYSSNADKFSSGPEIATIELSGWKNADMAQDGKYCVVKTTFKEKQVVLGTDIHGQMCTFYRYPEETDAEFNSTPIDGLLNDCKSW